MTKVIYLAGGCYWGVEKYISEISGVLSTEVGFANGNTEAPTYQQVRYENTGHAETVKVEYDPERLPLTALLNLFYKIIDPTSVDQQGEETVRGSLFALEKEIGQPLAVECCPLLQYFTAEEYHQKYLDKNPSGYCHVPFKMISWVKTVEPKDFA